MPCKNRAFFIYHKQLFFEYLPLEFYRVITLQGDIAGNDYRLPVVRLLILNRKPTSLRWL